jgi:myo-inositol-1(or 4)-monophosphatase
VDSEALVDLAVEAAHRAGVLLLERFRGPARGVNAKSTPTDLVSDADRDAEALLVDLLARERPDDGLLGEESAARPSSSGLTWVIDPLDGTVNFLFGIPVWSVSIAVEDPQGTVVGVVHDPTHTETYTARRGEGAALNGSPIFVSETADLSTALIGTGFAYDPQARRVQASLLPRLLPFVRDIRRAGSAALDLSSVACGRLDGFYEGTMERWDKAAGALLIAEAGGHVSELAAPREGLTPGLIAAGPELHDPLRDLVMRVDATADRVRP